MLSRASTYSLTLSLDEAAGSKAVGARAGAAGPRCCRGRAGRTGPAERASGAQPDGAGGRQTPGAAQWHRRQIGGAGSGGQRRRVRVPAGDGSGGGSAVGWQRSGRRDVAGEHLQRPGQYRVRAELRRPRPVAPRPQPRAPPPPPPPDPAVLARQASGGVDVAGAGGAPLAAGGQLGPGSTAACLTPGSGLSTFYWVEDWQPLAADGDVARGVGDGDGDPDGVDVRPGRWGPTGVVRRSGPAVGGGGRQRAAVGWCLRLHVPGGDPGRPVDGHDIGAVVGGVDQQHGGVGDVPGCRRRRRLLRSWWSRFRW